ncbi:uncharacterized protein LOC118421682 [Branchiostoma floridae]|uniref:Uncharacterized protein LOC118421682 n=1 Tax=Branchiostoma floridae TaxID=7739 RepID=A0A9J7LLG0_BRAFL|nr:uncharacterized protein LOC118421682 [Branchiostoma floridae]
MSKNPRCATDPLPKLPDEGQDSICPSTVTQLGVNSYEDVDRNVPRTHLGRPWPTKEASKSGRVNAEFQGGIEGRRDRGKETTDTRSPMDPLPIPPDDPCTARLFLAAQPRVDATGDRAETHTSRYAGIDDNVVEEHHGKDEITEDTDPGYHYYTGMNQAYLDAQKAGSSPQGQCAEDVTFFRRCVQKLNSTPGYVLAFCAGVAVAAVMAVIVNNIVITNHKGPPGHQRPRTHLPTRDPNIAPTNTTIAQHQRVTMGTTASTVTMLPASTTADDKCRIEPSLNDSSCASLGPLLGSSTGVYTINIAGQNVPVRCDMNTTGGGWTVIQRRFDGSVDFNREWRDYRDGFGHPSGEYWLGLEHVHQLTSQGSWTLRIELERRGTVRHIVSGRFVDQTLNPVDEPEGGFWAEYGFSVASQSTNYQLHLSGFSGTAGNSMNAIGYPWTAATGMMFSTRDRDNDGSLGRHCGRELKGGWWYNDCTLSGLNNKYPNDNVHCNSKKYIEWHTLSDRFHCLIKVSMKIRPTEF